MRPPYWQPPVELSPAEQSLNARVTRAPVHPSSPGLNCSSFSRVEHTLAHVGQWQGNRACYIRLRKNLFDLRRLAVVHNLHVIDRIKQPLENQQVL